MIGGPGVQSATTFDQKRRLASSTVDPLHPDRLSERKTLKAGRPRRITAPLAPLGAVLALNHGSRVVGVVGAVGAYHFDQADQQDSGGTLFREKRQLPVPLVTREAPPAPQAPQDFWGFSERINLESRSTRA